MKALQASRLAVLAALLLWGCSKPGGECVPVPPLTESLKEPNTAQGWNNKLSACLGRWGYSLASADGSVDDLAHAVLGGCRDALVTKVATQQSEDRRANLAVSPLEDVMRDARRDALETAAFYVAVGRAGRCPRPL